MSKLSTYFDTFFYPSLTYDRIKMGVREEFSLYEGIIISTIFPIIRAFFEVIFFFWILSILDLILGGVLASFNISLHIFYIYYVSLRLIFFPVFLYLIVKIWKIFLRITSSLFFKEKKENLNLDIDKVLAHCLSSSILYSIPGIGFLFSQLAFSFLLYIGLQEKLNIGKLESFMLVASSVILFLLSFLFLVLLFIFYLM